MTLVPSISSYERVFILYATFPSFPSDLADFRTRDPFLLALCLFLPLLPSRPRHKKAYYVAYGAHGPRAPIAPAGLGMRVFLGTGAAVIAAFGIFGAIRSQGKFIHFVWQEGMFCLVFVFGNVQSSRLGEKLVIGGRVTI